MNEMQVQVKTLGKYHRVFGFSVNTIIDEGPRSEWQQTVYDLLMAGF